MEREALPGEGNSETDTLYWKVPTIDLQRGGGKGPPLTSGGFWVATGNAPPQSPRVEGARSPQYGLSAHPALWAERHKDPRSPWQPGGLRGARLGAPGSVHSRQRCSRRQGKWARREAGEGGGGRGESGGGGQAGAGGDRLRGSGPRARGV